MWVDGRAWGSVDSNHLDAAQRLFTVPASEPPRARPSVTGGTGGRASGYPPTLASGPVSARYFMASSTSFGVKSLKPQK